MQIGDHRAGFYSYDWVERYLFPGTVHYVEGRHSATRIHRELQGLQVGDRINTGSIGSMQHWKRCNGSRAQPCSGHRNLGIYPVPSGDSRTRLLVRERDAGWLRMLAPRGSGLLGALAAAIDYAAGEPLHFVMVRKMMLGIKQRAETTHLDP